MIQSQVDSENDRLDGFSLKHIVIEESWKEENNEGLILFISWRSHSIGTYITYIYHRSKLLKVDNEIEEDTEEQGWSLLADSSHLTCMLFLSIIMIITEGFRLNCLHLFPVTVLIGNISRYTFALCLMLLFM